MTAAFQIGSKWVGDGHPVFVIAEAGVNHNGDPVLARKLVDAAVEAGADAVKFQSFTADRLVTIASPKAAYQQVTTDPAETQMAMLKKLEISPDMHVDLMEYAKSRGSVFLSTPFDAQNADLLERLGVPAFKMGSGELTDVALLAHVARKGRPMIVSTGMSWLAEVEQAVRAIREAGQQHLALMHCVSNYPADPADSNLRAIDTLRAAFQAPIGYSDHTEGVAIPIAAVARGACIIEKHLTLDRSLPGPDHKASVEPREFAELVRAIRTAELALGSTRKQPAASEFAMRDSSRKSVVALVDIPQGQVISKDAVGIRRPGVGLAPRELPSVVGRTAARDISAGTALVWNLLH